MWMPPKPAGEKETWAEWLEGWKMWGQQVGMNLWYGRGGLNVKVSSTLPVLLFPCFVFWWLVGVDYTRRGVVADGILANSDTGSGKQRKRKLRMKSGQIL